MKALLVAGALVAIGASATALGGIAAGQAGPGSVVGSEGQLTPIAVTAQTTHGMCGLTKDVDAVIAQAPMGKLLDLNVVIWRKITESEGAGQVLTRCAAEAVLSDASVRTVSYSFILNTDGMVFIKFQFGPVIGEWPENEQ